VVVGIVVVLLRSRRRHVDGLPASALGGDDPAAGGSGKGGLHLGTKDLEHKLLTRGEGDARHSIRRQSRRRSSSRSSTRSGGRGEHTSELHRQVQEHERRELSLAYAYDFYSRDQPNSGAPSYLSEWLHYGGPTLDPVAAAASAPPCGASHLMDDEAELDIIPSAQQEDTSTRLETAAVTVSNPLPVKRRTGLPLAATNGGNGGASGDRLELSQAMDDDEEDAFA
jgi:hypothetical protein